MNTQLIKFLNGFYAFTININSKLFKNSKLYKVFTLLITPLIASLFKGFHTALINFLFSVSISAFAFFVLYSIFNTFLTELLFVSVTSDIQILGLLFIRIKPSKILDSRFVHTSTGKNTEEKDIAYKGEFDNHMEELEEARKYSEPMTVLEYIESTTSSIEEAFPNLHKEKDIALPLIRKAMSNICKEGLEEEDLSKISMQDFLNYLEKQEGNTKLEKWTTLFSQTDYSKVSPEDVSQTVEVINKGIGNVTGTTSSNEISKVVEIVDNHLIIDIGFFKDALDKFTPIITENINTINVSGKIGIFGLSNLILYRALMRTYDKNNSVDLSKFNSDRAKLKVVQTLQKNRLQFSTYGALLLMAGLNTIYFASKILNSSQITIEAKTSSSVTDSNNNSILFLLGKNKINKFIFLVLLFVFIFPIVYIGYPFVKPVISYLNLILSSNLIYLKIFIAGMLNFTLLYEAIALYLINKYTTLNELPLFSKNIPKFITNKLNSLYEISKFEKNDRLLILEIMFKSLISLIILDLLLIFFIFISIWFN